MGVAGGEVHEWGTCKDIGGGKRFHCYVLHHHWSGGATGVHVLSTKLFFSPHQLLLDFSQFSVSFLILSSVSS